VTAAVELFPASGDLRLETGQLQFSGQACHAVQNSIRLIHVSEVREREHFHNSLPIVSDGLSSEGE
jgi:hypothetical protein